MKPDEIVFFKICFKMREKNVSVREVINLFSGLIHHKRCWYLLEKWSRLGFYDYGVNLELGWFYVNEMPDRYRNLLWGET